MEHMGWVSLIPPIIAIGLSVWFRNVVISLFVAIFVGLLIISGGNPVATSMTMVKDHLVVTLTDSYNAGVLVLLFFIGGFVALIEVSGGGASLANRTARFITTKTRAQVSTWIGGLIIFFSDLGTPLILGPIFERIFDKVKSSREKLAWILDCTMSPVAVLVPFIGWGIYIMGLMADEFERRGIEASEFDTFVQVIPFQMYAILTVISVPVVALAKCDFGPMRRAERRVAETGQTYWPGSIPLRGENATEQKEGRSPDREQPHAHLASLGDSFCHALQHLGNLRFPLRAGGRLRLPRCPLHRLPLRRHRAHRAHARLQGEQRCGDPQQLCQGHEPYGQRCGNPSSRLDIG